MQRLGLKGAPECRGAFLGRGCARSTHSPAHRNELGTPFAVKHGMDSQLAATRVAAAFTTNNGNTLCGFRTTAPAREAGRMFVSSANRVRRAGRSETAPVVLCIESARGNYRSIWEAERELDRALCLPSDEKPTVEVAAQR